MDFCKAFDSYVYIQSMKPMLIFIFALTLSIFMIRNPISIYDPKINIWTIAKHLTLVWGNFFTGDDFLSFRWESIFVGHFRFFDSKYESHVNILLLIFLIFVKMSCSSRNQLPKLHMYMGLNFHNVYSILFP